MQRLFLTLISAVVLLACACAAFWYQDLQYALPTPRPASLVQPAPGTHPALRTLIAPAPSPRPELLHFFNPGCPCSRFNVDHLRSLVRTYGHAVRFVAILQVEPGEAADGMEAFRDLELDMEAVVDSSGAIARQCGVYSTPQAVLIDTDGALYYRGNYNRTRYCTEKQTEFVRIALDSLLGHAALPVLPEAATVAYGCELPANTATTDN